MMKTCKTVALIVMITLFLCGSAFAVKPGNDVNPNGFPSGPHYNLNIISKKDNFQCPEQQYYWEIIAVPEGYTGSPNVGDRVENCPEGFTCQETNVPIYGNVIFVPEETVENVQIYVQSGSGKGTKTSTITELQVIDPCTGFRGEGAATLQLPANTNGGYDVYARALAKPTDNPNMVVTPELVAVEDEDGNDLIYLGLVTDNGFATPTETFTRTKGRSIAVPIRGLFEWSGSIIYFDNSYCVEGNCIEMSKCCIDADLNGIYEECIDPTDTGCAEGYTPLTVYEVEYIDEWVFNIGDFVTYLWSLENNGLKLLQVRFYPR
jgi:hypothetical protein